MLQTGCIYRGVIITNIDYRIFSLTVCCFLPPAMCRNSLPLNTFNWKLKTSLLNVAPVVLLQYFKFLQVLVRHIVCIALFNHTVQTTAQKLTPSNTGHCQAK